MSLFVTTHPLIKHKLGLLRRKEISTMDFRNLANEIATLLMYEATQGLETEPTQIECWSGIITVEQIKGKQPTLVPILRAGIGMLDGCLRMVPGAKISTIGVYRNEQSHLPIKYYSKLAKGIDQRIAFIIDPMLATGGSAIEAANILKNAGCVNIKGLFLVAAPEGVKALQENHPDIDIFAAAIDDKLDENAYIIPGLGDVGDKLFGTK